MVAFISIIYQSNFMTASQEITNHQMIEVVALALRSSTDGKYLLARRGPGGSGKGCWEFPGGKIEFGETQKQALQREIREELFFDLTAYELRFIGENTHQYETRKVKIYLWGAEVDEHPRFHLIDHDQMDWFKVKEMKEVNLSDADKYFISLLI